MSQVTIGAGLRSILIQVAFKGAIELRAAGKNASDIQTDMKALYDYLIAEHEARDAGDDPSDLRYKRGGGGGGGNRGGGGGGNRGESTAKVPNDAKPTLNLDYFGTGTPAPFYDLRSFKKGAANPHPQYGGQYSERSADFQSVNKIEDGKSVSLWLTFPNGDPNEEVEDLLAAATSSGSDERPF